jgi:cell division protease FtsH
MPHAEPADPGSAPHACGSTVVTDNNTPQPVRPSGRELARRFPPSVPELAPDIVEVTAALMVTSVLAAQPGLAEAVRADGSVTIVAVHDREWVLPVRRKWLHILFPEETPERLLTWSAVEADICLEETDDKAKAPRWFGFARDDATRKPDRGLSRDGLISAFQSGRPIFGWSHDPEGLLPQELQRMADRVVTIPPPTPDLIAEAADAFADAPHTTPLPEAVARATLPDHLLMAYRKGATADEVLRRLVRIVGERVVPPDPGERLEELIGMDEARDWGLGVARDLRDYRAGRIRWADMDRAILLAGPPGTGKTSFARRFATTCGVPLVIGSPQEWQGDRDGHLGHALGAMQRTFREARACAPCILFLDEIDGMGDRAHFHERHRDYSTSYLNGLLEQLDGLHGREGVVVVAACNYPERLDAALTRSGRLDRVLRIPLPDEGALTGMLRQRLGEDLPGADLGRVVRGTIGATGADVERWVRSARRRARHAGRPLAYDDLAAEVRVRNDVPPEIRRRAAIHEAGHAIVGWLDVPGSITRVSIGLGMTAGGFTEHRSAPLFTRKSVERHLRRILAGRAAEEVAFGDVSAGAGGSEASDLAKATMLATSALSVWGLASGSGGEPLVWRGETTAETLHRTLATDPALAAEVASILGEAYQQAVATLRAHRSKLTTVARALLERDVLDTRELAELLEGPGPEPDDLGPGAPRQAR